MPGRRERIGVAMWAVLVSFAVICGLSAVLGQAVSALCGFRDWSWLVPALGMALLMLLCAPALLIPGHTVTAAVGLGLITMGALVVLVRDRRSLPDAGGLVALVPAFCMAVIPFVAWERWFTLGVTINNDMAPHLAWAEVHRRPELSDQLGLWDWYPVAPHAVVGTLAEAMRLDVAPVFVGFTLATVVILAATTLAVFDRPSGVSWAGRALVATTAGLPFLVAAYYGQGAFKELLQALLVLAFALSLESGSRSSSVLRWVPSGLLVAGIVCGYSVQGLAWPVGILGVWVLIHAGRAVAAHGWRSLARTARVIVAPALLALGVSLLALLPQVPRIVRFVEWQADGGIKADDIGNLIDPLPFWMVFGVWDSSDFRMLQGDALTTGIWAGFVAVAAAAAFFWWLGQRRFALSVAVVVSTAIWFVAESGQSPYVAAKALMILSPLVLLLTTRAFVDPRGWSMPRWWSFVAPLVVAGIAFRVAQSSIEALRFSTVGDDTHARELKHLRDEMGGGSALFLGNDDFIRWELAGGPVRAPFINSPQPETPLRPEKAWEYGEPFDWDSVSVDAINDADWIITPRDPIASTPPAGVELVRTESSFQLWRRTEVIAPRLTLVEGQEPGAVLKCSTPDGRAISRQPGVAMVVPKPRAVGVTGLRPGGTVGAELALTPGRWTIALQYTGRLPVEVEVGSLHATLPPNLGRPGPRFWVGELDVAHGGPQQVTLTLPERPLLSERATGFDGGLIWAVRQEPVRAVPLSEACGAYVDWFRTES